MKKHEHVQTTGGKFKFNGHPYMVWLQLLSLFSRIYFLECVCTCGVCACDEHSFFCHQKITFTYKKVYKQGITYPFSKVYQYQWTNRRGLSSVRSVWSLPLSVAWSCSMALFNLFLRALFLARAPPTRLLVSATASSLPVEKKLKEVPVGPGCQGKKKICFNKKILICHLMESPAMFWIWHEHTTPILKSDISIKRYRSAGNWVAAWE